MIVRVDETGAVTLESPADFTRFHVEVHGISVQDAGVALQRAGAGRLGGDNRAFIARKGLVDLAGAAADEAWLGGLEKMIAYAKRKGWWDEATGAIAAHVESR